LSAVRALCAGPAGRPASPAAGRIADRRADVANGATGQRPNVDRPGDAAIDRDGDALVVGVCRHHGALIVTRDGRFDRVDGRDTEGY